MCLENGQIRSTIGIIVVHVGMKRCIYVYEAK